MRSLRSGRVLRAHAHGAPAPLQSVRAKRGAAVARAQQKAQQAEVALATFPGDYAQCVRQAQGAMKQAIADGVALIEVRFCSRAG